MTKLIRRIGDASARRPLAHHRCLGASSPPS